MAERTKGRTGPRMHAPILWGGLTVGVLDTLLAVVLYKVTVPRVYRSVAAGLLGAAASAGGPGTVALGMALHFFIATTAAAVYYAASRKLPLLVRQAVPCGLAYGVAVFFFMNYVVLQLSAVPRKPTFAWTHFQSPVFLGGLAGHAFLVGLPIALITRRFARRD